MDTVISKIADGQGSGSTETLLRLETPFLILRRMHRICRSLKARGSEVWIRLLNLSKALTCLKTFQKCRVRGVSIVGQAVRLTGSEVVAAYGEKIEERRIVSHCCPR